MFDPDNILHPRLRRLHAYWQAKQSGEALPMRGALDPVEMREFLGNLLLLELADDLLDSRYRLFGTTLSDYFEVDLTGLRLRDLPASDPESICAEYRAVLASGAPGLTRNQARIGRSINIYEKLLLPLGDGRGGIAMVLAAIYPVEQKSAVWP